MTGPRTIAFLEATRDAALAAAEEELKALQKLEDPAAAAEELAKEVEKQELLVEPRELEDPPGPAEELLEEMLDELERLKASKPRNPQSYPTQSIRHQVEEHLRSAERAARRLEALGAGNAVKFSPPATGRLVLRGAAPNSEEPKVTQAETDRIGPAQ
jgi:hypothetical protein